MNKDRYGRNPNRPLYAFCIALTVITVLIIVWMQLRAD